MTGTNTAGQGVEEMEFFESHFVEEQLILMVLFNGLTLSNVLVILVIPR